MTEMQLLLTVFIPTFAVLVGILVNKNGLSQVQNQIASLDVRLTAVENRLDARMTALDNTFHADMMMVIGKLTELEVRVAKLETQRQ